MTKIDNFDKPDFCPECGAPLVNNMNCWEQLGAMISLEYDDPDLLAEHFKTVACYNLQHPAQFCDEAIAGLRIALIEHLDKGLGVAEIRARNSKRFEGKQRVLKEPGERHFVRRKWKMTIADVYIPARPQGAAERVRKWALAIREDL